jgi:hypothetical protein
MQALYKEDSELLNVKAGDILSYFFPLSGKFE